MPRHAPMIAAAPLMFALAACGAPADEPPAAPAATSAAPAAATPGDASPSPAAASAGARPAAFAQCAACHAVEKGKHGVGPSLFGVYGTKSGEIAGYAFSQPMIKAGLTWDDATLDAYLAAPMKMVPGTKMTFPGLADAAKRKEIIEYMKTLK